MADEAFALSPISARAAMPSEADYDVIREAFMATSRGRWFLGEYARRNRNADTTMVLDAVARIEGSLAALRQPEVEDRVPEMLAAIRNAVEQAEAAAGAAFNPAMLEHGLDSVHRSIRVIREIAWRWREIGADGRICDVIDSQLAAIEGTFGQISAIDPRPELKAAFDLLKQRIEQAGISEDTAPQAAPVGMTGVVDETNISDVMDGHGVIGHDPTIADEPPIDAAAAEAEDDAVLEMVALEMAAPDFEFSDEFDLPSPTTVELTGPVSSDPTRKITEPAAIAVAPTGSPTSATALPPPVPTPSLKPAPKASLGSTTAAGGILQRLRTRADDPLGPIRRMTQAEKTAFFS